MNLRVTLIDYFTSDQTRIEFPWQVLELSENPPVSIRILTTSVGYIKGCKNKKIDNTVSVGDQLQANLSSAEVGDLAKS